MGREQYGVKDKFIPKKTLSTLLFGSFPANATVFFNCGSLTPYAKRRMFIVSCTLDQSLTGCTLRTVAGTNPSFVVVGYSQPSQSFNLGTGSSISVGDIGMPADTCYLVVTVGATAPSSGNVVIYVQEVI